MATPIETSKAENDRSYYFNIGGSHHRIHQLSLVKFPGSLFKELIEANPENSPSSRIRVDRSSKHFKTVLDLMRHGNVIYAQHLRRSEELAELLQELAFYRLNGLGRLVEEELIPHRDFAPEVVVTIHIDVAEHIQNLSRPLVVVDELTIRGIRNMLIPKIDSSLIGPGGIGPENRQLLTPHAFHSLFDHTIYDVRIFSKCFTGGLFKKERIVDKGTTFEVIHLCLYMPGLKPALKLIVDAHYASIDQFRETICKFLIAADVVVNYPPEYHKDKLSSLTNISFKNETDVVDVDHVEVL